MSKQNELRRLLKQTDTFLERASVMLSTGKRGEPFPPNTEFSEEETKSYENSLITLASQLLKVPDVPRTTWYPPIQYAYRYVEGQKKTKWTWLEQFHTGLLNTKSFFNTFLEDTSNKEYNLNIENSTGVIIAIENENSTIELINNLSDNDLNELGKELAQLRNILKSKSKTREHDIAIGRLAEAEVSATNKDKKGLLVNLKKTGNWVFETATKIGISVTSKIISEMIKTQ